MTFPPGAETRAGDLVWGIRRAFVSYVEQVGGTIQVFAPASRAGEGPFKFPRATTEPGAHFSGLVEFSAHGDALKLRIGNPSVEWDDVRGAMLIVDAPPNHPTTRVPIATLGTDGSAALTREGTELFDFQYPEGTPLDPVSCA